MRSKYLVRLPKGGVAGLRHDAKREEVLVGGPASLRAEIGEVLRLLLPAVHPPEDGRRVGSRLHVTAFLSVDELERGLVRLMGAGYVLEPVRNFRRLMT